MEHIRTTKVEQVKLLDRFSTNNKSLKGFMVLIEKDWISFGHKFSERCGHLDGDPREVSPVFTQFLECVWHLTQQFPQAFEFNEAFLLQIHEHIHSCQFGNFLGNCQKEREELRLKEKTYSLWPFLLDDKKKYLNPLYSSKSQRLTVLEPNTASFNFKFWRNMYHQFDRTLHPRQSVLSIIMNMNEQSKQLEERDCHDIYNSLLQLSKQAKYEDLYAFSYNPKQNDTERRNGWQLIDLAAEYERMGVPNANWQLSDANREYKVCETYPRELYVPRTASRPVIVGSSNFRSKGRLPVLSYCRQGTEAAICRCSQPLSGFSARCLEDEHLLQAISKANPGNRYMYVVDTRPKLNAIANRAAGKGYENEDNYSNIRFQFVGIENIHVMRSSLQKLLEVNGSKGLSVNDFYSGLESSGWLRHIKAVLDAAIFLAKAIVVENASVLVHCSDGWDRTSQVCSLGSLLLDSYYRTMKGFMVLIENGNPVASGQP